MGATEHVVRTALSVQILLIGCWSVVTFGASGSGPVAASGPNLASGTYDAGESLRIGQRWIPLLRSRQKVAVIQAPTTGIEIAATPGNHGKGIAGCAFGCKLMPSRSSEATRGRRKRTSSTR